MNKIIDATQKQVLRGRILSLCNELGAMGAGVTIMNIIFKKQSLTYSENDITEACRYLQDKDLITYKHIQSNELNLERDIAYITAAGIDVLEATTSVDGVIIG